MRISSGRVRYSYRPSGRLCGMHRPEFGRTVDLLPRLIAGKSMRALAKSTQNSLLPARRRFLSTAGLGALGLFWADWIRAQAAGADNDRAKARSVILIFNAGAPSHIDLWDMKPNAPDNIRGPFQPIATNVPGIQISELL